MLVLLLSMCSVSLAKVGDWNKIKKQWKNLEGCHLRLVCAITSREKHMLEESFMKGIRALSKNKEEHSAAKLDNALKAGTDITTIG